MGKSSYKQKVQKITLPISLVNFNLMPPPWTLLPHGSGIFPPNSTLPLKPMCAKGIANLSHAPEYNILWQITPRILKSMWLNDKRWMHWLSDSHEQINHTRRAESSTTPKCLQLKHKTLPPCTYIRHEKINNTKASSEAINACYLIIVDRSKLQVKIAQNYTIQAYLHAREKFKRNS